MPDTTIRYIGFEKIKSRGADAFNGIVNTCYWQTIFYTSSRDEALQIQEHFAQYASILDKGKSPEDTIYAIPLGDPMHDHSFSPQNKLSIEAREHGHEMAEMVQKMLKCQTIPVMEYTNDHNILGAIRTFMQQCLDTVEKAKRN